MTNIDIAKSYYTHMRDKNVEAAGKHLHPDVVFISPMAEMKGKKDVLEAAHRWVEALDTLTIRSIFESSNQAALVCNAEFPQPLGTCRTTSLMDIQDDLIMKIELFYDARPFDYKKKEEIFG